MLDHVVINNTSIINDTNYELLLTEYDLPKNYFKRKEKEKEERLKNKPLLHAQSLLQNAKKLIDNNNLLP